MGLSSRFYTLSSKNRTNCVDKSGRRRGNDEMDEVEKIWNKIEEKNRGRMIEKRVRRWGRATKWRRRKMS